MRAGQPPARARTLLRHFRRDAPDDAVADDALLDVRAHLLELRIHHRRGHERERRLKQLPIQPAERVAVGHDPEEQKNEGGVGRRERGEGVAAHPRKYVRHARHGLPGGGRKEQAAEDRDGQQDQVRRETHRRREGMRACGGGGGGRILRASEKENRPPTTTCKPCVSMEAAGRRQDSVSASRRGKRRPADEHHSTVTGQRHGHTTAMSGLCCLCGSTNQSHHHHSTMMPALSAEHRRHNETRMAVSRTVPLNAQWIRRTAAQVSPPPKCVS